MPLYRIAVTCDGLTDAEGTPAPSCILEEFRHRPWHQNVRCNWAGGLLRLEAENDCDAKGQALLDEFWDVVIACIKVSTEIEFKIVSVCRLPIGT